MFEGSLIENWDIPALADYQGESMTYSQVANQIARMHAIFEACDVKAGDKVALVGKNSMNWAVTYLAVVNYGAVIVPLLSDFPIDSLHNLINHSDAVVLFAAESIYRKMDASQMPALRSIVSVDDYSLLYEGKEGIAGKTQDRLQAFDAKYPNGIVKEDVLFNHIDLEQPAVISYTSGTTGVSKGVVIPHRSLLGNMIFAQKNMPLDPGDKIVSFLPLAHTYGCAFEFLFPFTIGCSITFLTKTPSPATILKAFGEIKPALILSVPLVIEKIYKKKIKPTLEKPSMKILTAIPGVKNIIFKKIKASVYESFGGCFRELVIGGAALNPETELFFKKIKFPFTIGYGMTECGPLISYASWNTTELQASGREVNELEVKIDSEDQQNVIGEIIMRGSHVMLGYYKNEEETNKVIDADGWFHSGDLGTIDAKGNIYIKGRKKSMLLSSSGKNIYPDEIESILNSMKFVLESLVVMRNNNLVAILVPDPEVLKAEGKKEADLDEIFKSYLVEVNKKLAKFMQLSGYETRMDEFEKTPKRSIKRFLYK